MDFEKECSERTQKLITTIVDQQKEELNNKGIVIDFSQYEAVIKETIETEINKLKVGINKLKVSISKGVNAIQNGIDFEESLSPLAASKPGFKIFEDCMPKFENLIKNDAIFELKEDLMDTLQIPWTFMDRAYGFALKFFSDGKYDEAEGIYRFLTIINGKVTEYWLGLASSLYMQEKYLDAYINYSTSIMFDPTRATTYYNIAFCFYNLKEYQECLNAIEKAKEVSSDERTPEDFMERVEELKSMVIQKIEG